MYTQDSVVAGNRSVGNHAGWVIMYSDRLEVRDNVSIDDRDHGLMLNTANSSEITGNVVRNGGEKCVFIYNANKNSISGNWFEGCPIGIRSEEHTSELQSLMRISYAVFCLKKQNNTRQQS